MRHIGHNMSIDCPHLSFDKVVPTLPLWVFMWLNRAIYWWAIDGHSIFFAHQVFVGNAPYYPIGACTHFAHNEDMISNLKFNV